MLDGRPNRRDEATFTNLSGIVGTGPEKHLL